ncbi:unnamed protein product [Trifolium pratense]|uniref:Uncharacterized protein n=1 Tax=Trifolium pratense TaxID=57577 RepID=A0ACB0L1E4_TRIPR|nr:unnamed protein product [Trifolium pratense]
MKFCKLNLIHKVKPSRRSLNPILSESLVELASTGHRRSSVRVDRVDASLLCFARDQKQFLLQRFCTSRDIPKRLAKDTKIFKVSFANLCCLATGNASSVIILCNRSANLMKIALASGMARNIIQPLLQFPISSTILFGCSPQSASKLCSTYNVTFKTAQKPDSVLTFFNSFSNSQLRDIVAKLPGLLSCNPSIRVLPKFQFLLSKGASNSDIVNLVSKSQPMNWFIDCCNQTRTLLLVQYNFQLYFATVSIEELKDLGINPSRISFGIALKAKLTVSKTLWKEKDVREVVNQLKVNAFKKWGWSDEDVREAFKKMPHCMLASIDKINLVMSFWVNQLGWDALALVKGPAIFSNSLEKRIIPRASVVQFLLKKGLRKKDASLTYPFVVSEQVFLDTCIKRFMEESSYLLKLYEEKLCLAQTRDKTGIS